MTTSFSAIATYPTSTGTPNCSDRSPFSGTLNGGYLILCDTALPGYTLAQANGTDLADCITACTNYVNIYPSDPCVAVEYDPTTINQCTLKSNIGVVSTGGDAIAQAAILVDAQYAPSITFSTVSSAMSSTTMGTTSMTTTTSGDMRSTSTGSGVTTTTQSETTLPTSATTAPVSDTTTSSTITTTAQTSSSTTGTPTRAGSTSTSGTTTTSTTTSTSASTSSTSLCPGSNNTEVQQPAGGGTFYEIFCSTQLVGIFDSGNASTAISLAICIDFCNVLNQAQPYGCVGVTYLAVSSHFPILT